MLTSLVASARTVRDKGHAHDQQGVPDVWFGNRHHASNIPGKRLGADLRLKLLAHLQNKHPEYEAKDLGNFDKYYEGAYEAGGLVQQSRDQGGQDRALLACGTGMGMSIIANKFPDVYAAVVESVAAAGNAAAINNANVLALGGTLWKEDEAGAAVDKWLLTAFTEGYDQYKDFLVASMQEIPAMVHAASPAAAAPPAGSSSLKQHDDELIHIDGQQPDAWKPWEVLGHPACLSCPLGPPVLTSTGQGPRSEERMLLRLSAGCVVAAHHLDVPHDMLVLSGCLTVRNHRDTTNVLLKPCGFLHIPALLSHSLHVQDDTVLLLQFFGRAACSWDHAGGQHVECPCNT